MLQAHAISAAVLSPAMSRHSATCTSSRRSKSRSAPWPAIRRCTAADRQRAAHTPYGGVSSSRSWASTSSASPARIAGADAEDRPRRRPVPPLGVAVHDVVVQQREVVHQLHRRSGRRQRAPARRRPRAPTAAPAPGAAPCRPRRPAIGWPARRRQAQVVGGDQAARPGSAGRPRPRSPARRGRAPSRLRPAWSIVMTHRPRPVVGLCGADVPAAGREASSPISCCAAGCPLRTAPSMVSGQPVSVHAPASASPGTAVAAPGRSAPEPGACRNVA